MLDKRGGESSDEHETALLQPGPCADLVAVQKEGRTRWGLPVSLAVCLSITLPITCPNDQVICCLTVAGRRDATLQELRFLVRAGALKNKSTHAVLLSLGAACSLMEGVGCSPDEVRRALLQYKHNQPGPMPFGGHMFKS